MGKEKKMPPIMVKCLPDEKVSDIIERYRVKTCNYKTDIKFIFNAKVLNKDLTICENGMADNANIFIVETKKLQDQ